MEAPGGGRRFQREPERASSSEKTRRPVWIQPAGTARLLDEVPDLAVHLDRRIVGETKQRVTVGVGALRDGRWEPKLDPACYPEDLGLLVLDGRLLRRVGVGIRASSELLLPGDLLRPHHPDAHDDALISQPASWRVLEPARLAIIDAQVQRVLAPLQGVMGELVGCAVGRSRSLAFRLAVARHRSLDTRLQLLLWHLYDRCGRREGGKLVVPFEVGQETLGELVAVGRQSVNRSINRLRRRGTLGRRDGGGFVLRGAPPEELLGEFKVAESRARASTQGEAST